MTAKQNFISTGQQMTVQSEEEPNKRVMVSQAQQMTSPEMSEKEMTRVMVSHGQQMTEQSEKN